MTIDTASREPAPESDREPEPGPLFDIRRPIYEAVIASGGQRTGVFSSLAFCLAMAREFGMDRAPGEEWAASVLRKVEHVTELPGHRWKVQTN
jgi:hypothetical protein